MPARRSRPTCWAVDFIRFSARKRAECHFRVAVLLVYGMPTTNAGEL
jgi:hypothetical protein